MGLADGKGYTKLLEIGNFPIEAIRKLIEDALKRGLPDHVEIKISQHAVPIEQLRCAGGRALALPSDGSDIRRDVRFFRVFEVDLEPLANLGHPHLFVLFNSVREGVVVVIMLKHDWPLHDDVEVQSLT